MTTTVLPATDRTSRMVSVGTRARLGRSLAAVIGALALLAAGVLTAGPAHAHAQLLETDPEDGAQVDQAPDTIELTFNENIEQIGAEIVITDADGNEVQDGEPEIAGPTLTHDLDGERPAGQYTVLWRVVSADGHPVSGEFTFTADAPAGQDTADAATDADEAPEDEAPEDEAAEDEAPEDGGAAEDDGAGNGAEDTAAQAGEEAEPADDPVDPADPVAGGAEGGIPWGLVFALALVGVLLALVVRARRQLRERQEYVQQQNGEYRTPGSSEPDGGEPDGGEPDGGEPGDPDGSVPPGDDGDSAPDARGEDDPRG